MTPPPPQSSNYENIIKKGRLIYLDSLDFDPSGIYMHQPYQSALRFINLYQDWDVQTLRSHAGLILAAHIDECYLMRRKDVIQEYLAGGGIVLSFCGLYQAFLLPHMNGKYSLKKSRQPTMEQTILQSSHPIFNGISEHDLNYLGGAKGLFSGGCFSVDANANVILSNDKNECLAFIDISSTKGFILATAGACLLSYSAFNISSARKMGYNLLNFIDALIKNMEQFN